MTTEKVTGKTPARKAVAAEAASVRRTAAQALADKDVSDKEFASNLADAHIHTRVIEQEKADADKELADRLGQALYMLKGDEAPYGVTPPPATPAEPPTAPAADLVPPAEPPATPPAQPGEASATTVVLPTTAAPQVVVVKERNHFHPREWSWNRPSTWLLLILGVLVGLIIANGLWTWFAHAEFNTLVASNIFLCVLLKIIFWIAFPAAGFFFGGAISVSLAERREERRLQAQNHSTKPVVAPKA
jgi:hypothetical protein